MKAFPFSTIITQNYGLMKKKLQVGLVGDYSNVICCLKEKQKFNAIKEIVYGCPVFEDIDDKDRFLQAVIRREEIETTGIGRGVAIAHGKIRNIDRIRVGLGISSQGIDFGASDGYPVYLLFVIGSSPIRQVEYLKTLASIMRYIKMSNVRNELLRHKQDLDFSQEKVDNCLNFLHMLEDQQFSMLSV